MFIVHCSLFMGEQNRLKNESGERGRKKDLLASLHSSDIIMNDRRAKPRLCGSLHYQDFKEP